PRGLLVDAGVPDVAVDQPLVALLLPYGDVLAPVEDVVVLAEHGEVADFDQGGTNAFEVEGIELEPHDAGVHGALPAALNGFRPKDDFTPWGHYHRVRGVHPGHAGRVPVFKQGHEPFVVSHEDRGGVGGLYCVHGGSSVWG